ncbi:expansin EXLX1 family cellulose-binding protein [Actinomadura parmotrematis]|uniref:Expansin-like CBD domain-containing protein n=1 Tax=Actinomadura parmotrematis TaxID=2864039 RepID=A0ABS7FYS5_9ACTN|nr:expansin EXLX1 family cellulose-binding protein [Actinomadura parmotrematis]MBW8485426.1 hypothetical protein [Actinomadura parmotrematis]
MFWAVAPVAVIGALGFGLVQAQSRACAAVPPGRAPAAPAVEGSAVFHRDWSEVLCSLAPLRGGHYVSLSAAEFGTAGLCGSFIDVRGPRGRVRAMVVDRCGGCGEGRIDLSEAAFRRVAGGTARGVAAVAYRRVRDPLPAPALAFRVKPGSSRDWLGLLVSGHGNPLARVEVKGRDGWAPLRRGLDNYWTTGSRPGGGPFTVRVTDRFGDRAVVPRIALDPGRTQRTGAHLYAPRPRPHEDAESPLPVPPLPSASGAPAAPAAAPVPRSRC